MRTLVASAAALVLIALLAVSPLALWWRRAASPVRVLVVGKTVPHPDYREHSALFWTLNHFKAVPPGAERPWTSARDYVGFHPATEDADGASFRTHLTADSLAAADLVYLADAYGVYEGDYLLPGGQAALDYSERIFGGFERHEVDALESFTEKGGALVAEFNTVASPTTGENRARLEKLLGIRWTGWAGRHFPELGDESEVPAWAPRNWLRQHGADWMHSGPGLLFAHEDGRIFVLAMDQALSSGGVEIHTTSTQSALLSGVEMPARFDFWFDVVEASGTSRTLAEYVVPATERGLETMKQFQVPDRFPAVVASTQGALALYLAGDFSDNNVVRGPYYVAGWPAYQGFFASRSSSATAASFYWNFYAPLIGNVLSQVEREKEAK